MKVFPINFIQKMYQGNAMNNPNKLDWYFEKNVIRH